MEPRKSARASVRWGLSSLVAAAMLAGVMGGCEMGGINDGGTNNGGTSGGGAVNDAPDLTFTKPNSSGTVYIGQVLQVAWYATDYDNATVTTLFYDKDGLKGSGDEMQLTQVQKPAKDYSESSFAWDTSQMPPGTYRLLATISDGVNPIVTVYSNYTINLVSSSPTINVVEPYGPKSVMPAENVVINWTQYAPLGQSTVTLFFDTNTSYSDGITNTILTKTEQPNTSSDSYVWNVPAVKAGQYYLGAILNDGTHPPTVAYANGVLGIGGPAIQVFTPSANIQWHSGGSTQIRYQVNSPHGGTVRIFYDRDTVPGSGQETWLPYTANVVTQEVTWTWTSTPLPSGKFYIGVEVNDGVNDPVIGYSTGTIEDVGPVFSLTSPGGPVTVRPGDQLPIAWTYQINGAGSQVHLFWDNNTTYTPAEDDVSTRSITDVTLQPSASPSQGSYTWSVPLLPIGTYYIGAKLTSGGTVQVYYATGDLAMQGPQLNITDPAIDLNILPGDPVVIKWSNTIPGTNPKIRFFYNTVQTDVGATTIVQDLNPNTLNGSYTWSTPATLTGTVYVGAIVTDDLGQPTSPAFAPGKVNFIDRTSFVHDLAKVELGNSPNTLPGWGRTFRGFDPGGRLGREMPSMPWVLHQRTDSSGKLVTRVQPGVSTNGDANDDFMLVAPTASPHYAERRGAGEAYLVQSNPTFLFPAPPLVDVFPTYLNILGSADLPGAIFSGPAQSNVAPRTNEGLGGIAISRDADGDGHYDFIFGAPLVNVIAQEEQDYDPWDSFLDDFMLTTWQTTIGAGFPSYGDKFRRPYKATKTVDDGAINLRWSNQTGWDTIESGMVVVVSGDLPPITAPAGQATPQYVVDLDNVGQRAVDPHPAVIDSLGNNAPAGIRMYGPWWFDTENATPYYYAWLYGPLTTVPPKDDSRFGKYICEADLDGDNYPDWVVVQPDDPLTGNPNEGKVHVIFSRQSFLWNRPLSSLIDNSSGFLLAHVYNYDTTAGTYVYQSDVQSPVCPMDVNCYSWPSAFTYGTLEINVYLTYNITVGGTTTTVPTTISVVNNSTDRWWLNPMMVDYIEGDSTDAPVGDLHNAANVGDFNHDTREDFVIGAPAGKSNAGCAYLVFGRGNFGDHNLGDIGKTDPQALAGIKITGLLSGAKVDSANLVFDLAQPHYGDNLGFSQIGAGDFNGDGDRDWVLGIPGYDYDGRVDCGAVAVIFGSRTKQGKFSVSDIGTLNLPGVIFVGESAKDLAGLYVAGVGDADGDGYDDIVIAAPGANSLDGTRTHCGRVYLIYGGPGFGTAGKTLVDLGNAAKAGLPAMIYEGPTTNSQVGTLGPAGDVDGDGYADWLIGNPNADVLDPTDDPQNPTNPRLLDCGEVYLIRGFPRTVNNDIGPTKPGLPPTP